MNKKDKNGNTPLHSAASGGCSNSIKVLLKNGALIEEKNYKGETALFLAVSLQRVEAVRCLIENGGDMWAENNNGTTVLHAAALSGNEVILDILSKRSLEFGVKTDEGRELKKIELDIKVTECTEGSYENSDNSSRTKDRENRNVDDARLEDSKNLANSLSYDSISKSNDYKIDQNGSPQTKLEETEENYALSNSEIAAEGEQKCVNNLYKCNSQNSIIKTTQNGCKEPPCAVSECEPSITVLGKSLNNIAEQKYKLEAERSYCDMTSVTKQKRCRHKKNKSKVILEIGAENVNRNNNIKIPVKDDCRTMEKKVILLPSNTNPSDSVSLNVRPPSVESAKSDRDEMDDNKPVSAINHTNLLKPQEEKTSNEAFDKISHNNIMFSCSKDNFFKLLINGILCEDVIMVRTILKTKRVDVNAGGVKGATPLITAAFVGSVTIIRELYNAGAELMRQDHLHATALHMASCYNNVDAVKLLLSLGSNPDIQDYAGDTPLHVAVRGPHPLVVAALLKSGANKNIKNHNNKSPFDYAKERRHLIILRLLRQNKN